MRNQIKIIGIAITFLFMCLSCDDYIRTPVEDLIYVNKSTITGFVGDEQQLTASPTDGTFNFQWLSENPEIATVSSTGLVTFISEGSTVIVVADGDIRTKINLTAVVRIGLEGFTLSDTLITLFPGSSKIIGVKRMPENANDVPSGIWFSENTKVATVNDMGEIVGVGEGVTQIKHRIGTIENTVTVDVALTRPFAGPHVLQNLIPYELPMANFDFGGAGYAFNDDDQNSVGNDNYRRGKGDDKGMPVEVEGDGANIGYTKDGEWLLYSVEVKDAGVYQLQVALSATGDGLFHIEVDNKNVTGSLAVANNGSWSDWRWTPAAPILLTLSKGQHKIKFYIEKATYNLRALRFTKQ